MGNTHVIVEKKNRAGFLTLNRPKSLNALSGEMFDQLSAALDDWQKDPEIYGVVLDAVGDEVFCAGGDLREVYELGREDPELACRFLSREYHYNWQLECFTKPHIALLNGLVLGGGAGISLYGTHRVAGENFALAMPETAIGFIPDVGGSWFLGHLPYSVGLYLALTGRKITRADAYSFGLVTHTIDAKHFPAIKDAVRSGEPVDQILDEMQTDPGDRELKRLHGWIEAIFSASSLEEIFKRAKALDDISDGWSLTVLDELQQKSPTSLHLALKLWKKGRYLSLRRALQMEYDVVCNLLRQDDFYEGIRAVLIDKDAAPRWNPEKIADISREDIRKLFKNHRKKLNIDYDTMA